MPSRQPSLSHSRQKSRAAGADEAQTTESLALAVIDANQRWWALQIEAMHAALAENTQQAKTMLENASKTADTFAQWPSLYGEKTRRYTDLTRIGTEIAAQMFTQLNQLMGQLFSASLAGVAGLEAGAEAPGETAEDFIERRVAARIISFPDRRKSSQQQIESAEGAEKSQTQFTRRRKSA
ncbi:MAG: hypothetical protein HYU78_11020 [Rhodocyclales bacterium]|nr:hypothetical protein [Rhodocyclales bacterium]